MARSTPRTSSRAAAPFVLIPEAADELVCSVDSVRRLLRDGAFPRAYQLRTGGAWRIPRRDLDAYIAKRATVDGRAAKTKTTKTTRKPRKG